MNSKTAIAVLTIATGITVMIGSVTGNLGGMLAALFDPSDLPALAKQNQKTNSGASGIIKDIVGGVPGLGIAANGL